MEKERIDSSWKEILIYTEGEGEMELEKFLDTLYIKKEGLPEVGQLPGTSYVLYKEETGLWHIERITNIRMELLEKNKELEMDEERLKRELGEEKYGEWCKRNEELQ